MQKVLITGCGIGKKMGLCDACNLDFTWLFSNASTMLWADKICLPRDLFNNTINHHRNKSDLAIAIMLQTLKEKNLIELLDDNLFETPPDVLDYLRNQMANDVVEMGKAFPEIVKINEITDSNYLNITICDQEYCLPYIGSIYASMYLADEIKAHCLFNDHSYTFLKYKSGLDYKKTTHKAYLDTYNDIFSFVLPNDFLPPDYAMTSEERCSECNNISKCSSEYEKNVKGYINKILSYRCHDELFQLRNEIEKIISQIIVQGEDVTSDAVKNELIHRQEKINTLIHRRFEQVKRWSKIATICSLPTTIISAVSANVPIAVTAAAITGASKAAEKVMEIYESKKKWVGFIQMK